MRAIAACAKFRTEHSASAADICAVGQTLAAHELCAGLRPYRKRHHIQSGVGHYGVFSGRAWANQIYLMVKNGILQSD